MRPPNGYVTVAEAATIASVSCVDTVYRWMNLGLVKSVRVGVRRRFVDLVSLEEYIRPKPEDY